MLNGRAASVQIRDFFRTTELRNGVTMRESVAASAQILRGTRALAALGLLIAAQAALGSVAVIPIGQHIRIGFEFLAIAAAGMLFGPVPAAVCAGCGDVVLYIIRGGGPFFPGFTLTAAMTGFIYGLAFFKRRVALMHIVIAQLAVSLVANLLVNSVNLQILYGNVTGALLFQRAIKNLVMLPINTALLSVVLPPVRSAYRHIIKS